jgi:hypothetical protein
VVLLKFFVTLRSHFSLFFISVTDVEDLYNWNISKLNAHPLFKQVIVSSETFAEDPCINAMLSSTEEGNKVLFKCFSLTLSLLALILPFIRLDA